MTNWLYIKTYERHTLSLVDHFGLSESLTDDIHGRVHISRWMVVWCETGCPEGQPISCWQEERCMAAWGSGWGSDGAVGEWTEGKRAGAVCASAGDGGGVALDFLHTWLESRAMDEQLVFLSFLPANVSFSDKNLRHLDLKAKQALLHHLYLILGLIILGHMYVQRFFESERHDQVWLYFFQECLQIFQKPSSQMVEC